MEKVITFGEIMLRLATPGHNRFIQAHSFDAVYGGSEANVAVSLKYLGVDAAHVTRFPENDLGISAKKTLQYHGVDTRHVIFGPERMGIYFIENGAMQRTSRIIYDRFDSAFAHIKPGMIPWEAVFQGATWFHWTGITPAISQGAADVCLEALVAAQKMGLTISGDINYRRNLWQYGKSARAIMPSLISKSNVIVAGIADMENSAGISGSTYEEACGEFVKVFPSVKLVTTTIRESISASHNTLQGVLWSEGNTHVSKVYDITHMVDRIGGGDAYMAGIIYGIMHKKSNTDTVEFATAASTLKHAIVGDVNIVTASEVEALVNGENVGKLLR
jgi:2-dehydro-3-deoxygluconokinase